MICLALRESEPQQGAIVLALDVAGRGADTPKKKLRLQKSSMWAALNGRALKPKSAQQRDRGNVAERGFDPQTFGL